MNFFNVLFIWFVYLLWVPKQVYPMDFSKFEFFKPVWSSFWSLFVNTFSFINFTDRFKIVVNLFHMYFLMWSYIYRKPYHHCDYSWLLIWFYQNFQIVNLFQIYDSRPKSIPKCILIIDSCNFLCLSLWYESVLGYHILSHISNQKKRDGLETKLDEI